MLEPKITITQEILKLIAEIDEFKGKWEAFKNLAPDRLKILRKIATVESVASSTRIEGVTLSNAEVETIIDNLRHQSFTTRDEQEVAGYAEAMDLVFESYTNLNLTENHIKQLHSLLLKYSDKDQRHKGEYKKLSNSVAAFDETGKQVGIIFETATPFETPLKMEELVKWVIKAFAEKTHHELLIIAVFIVVFLAIHPFQDGNGRLSRILTTLLLLRSGYAYVPYSSMESVIEENKDLYYKALRRTQTTIKDEEPNWESWVAFFLRSMKKQKDNLEKRIEREKLMSTKMPELASEIMALFNTYPRLGIAEIEEMSGANKNTLKVRLRELVKEGLLLKHGKARATWYTLSKGSV